MRVRPIKAITFGCFGTLVDWEPPVGEALTALLPADHPAVGDPGDLFRRWRAELVSTERDDARSYREILRAATETVLERLGVDPAGLDTDGPERAMGDALPFPDVKPALQRLKGRYTVGVVSNVGRELMGRVIFRMAVPLAPVVTAEQAGGYKASGEPFRLSQLDIGLPVEQVLHASANPRGDLDAARELGLKTAWIDRGRQHADDEEIACDYVVPSLSELCELLGV